ncbi:MAG TPA: hypothetical protein VGK23_07765 [Methanomassiliicoccales archaeon]|jgi:hypothetical protein
MSETSYRSSRDRSFDDLESVVQSIDIIPSMSPKLSRIGSSRPRRDRNDISVVEIGFRNFRKGQLNFREYDLYE